MRLLAYTNIVPRPLLVDLTCELMLSSRAVDMMGMGEALAREGSSDFDVASESFGQRTKRGACCAETDMCRSATDTIIRPDHSKSVIMIFCNSLLRNL